MSTKTAAAATTLDELWGAHLEHDALVTLLGGPRPAPSIPPIADREFWSTVDRTSIGGMLDRAESERGTPWPQPLLSQYARYFRDGNRTDYEGAVGERQRRLSRAAVVAALENDVDAIDEVADGVVLLCEQSSWSWAAHDDVFQVSGAVLPDIGRPYLDLGAGEVVGQLAYIDALLGSALDDRAPGLRRRMRQETSERVIDPFLERRDWHWLGLDGDVHNWNPWIHGNVLLAALHLVDDVDRRARVIASVIDGLDRYLASLPEDGAIDEGFSYWFNGAGRLLEALDVLADATGGVLDAGGLPVIREVLRFPHRMHLGGERYVNVADGPSRSGTTKPWHVLHQWGRRLGDEDVASHAAAQRAGGRAEISEEGGLGRLLRALTDEDWRDAVAAAPLVGASWFPSVQLLVARESAGEGRGFSFAAKGGHNGEHHNHLDVGSVMVAHDGRPVLVDAGQPTYTALTFGPRRYEIRAMRSEWHSVPMPHAVDGGIGQGIGEAFGATVVTVEPEDGILELDLTGAYPLGEPSSIRRRIALDGDRVLIEDRWELERGLTLHYLIAGEISLDGDGALVRPREGGGALRLRWHGTTATVATEVWDLDDPLLTDSWGPRLTRLALHVDESTGSSTLVVESATT